MGRTLQMNLFYLSKTNPSVLLLLLIPFSTPHNKAYETAVMQMLVNHSFQTPSFWVKPLEELNNIWKTIQYTRSKQEAIRKFNINSNTKYCNNLSWFLDLDASIDFDLVLRFVSV